MSCETLNQQQIALNVSMGQLPEGFCPASMQELAAAIAQRLIITPSAAFTSFASGSTAPSSNVGPWLKDCETWYVWDDSIGAYVPMSFPQISAVRTGTIHAWGGTVSNIPEGYLLCDGSVKLKADYPLLYAAIGDCYAPSGSPCPTCEGSFYLPNICNRFVVGACVDDGGCAKSNVSDGATLLKERDYTPHTHSITLPGLQAPPSQTQAGVNLVQEGSYTTGPDNPRAIPPFIALPYIIKT